jgi:hypothetical protein
VAVGVEFFKKKEAMPRVALGGMLAGLALLAMHTINYVCKC